MEVKNDQASCQHENFSARCAVNRMMDIGEFHLDVKVCCTDCGLPFRFCGLPPGLLANQPSVSVDGEELRCPIKPGLSMEDTMRGHREIRFEVPGRPESVQ